LIIISFFKLKRGGGGIIADIKQINCVGAGLIKALEGSCGRGNKYKAEHFFTSKPLIVLQRGLCPREQVCSLLLHARKDFFFFFLQGPNGGGFGSRRFSLGGPVFPSGGAYF